jgi:hypothetical protein
MINIIIVAVRGGQAIIAHKRRRVEHGSGGEQNKGIIIIAIINILTPISPIESWINSLLLCGGQCKSWNLLTIALKVPNKTG